jgi:ATP-dependent Zn protease
LEKVTNLAYAEIVQYGMNSKFGSLSYSNNNSRGRFRFCFFVNSAGYMGKPYSDETATMVDEEVITLVENFYQDTIKLVQENIQRRFS